MHEGIPTDKEGQGQVEKKKGKRGGRQVIDPLMIQTVTHLM